MPILSSILRLHLKFTGRIEEKEKMKKKYKRNEVITFRLDSDLKNKIEIVANEKEWSISKTIEYICKKHFTKETAG